MIIICVMELHIHKVVFIQTHINLNGCDSLHTLNLTINNSDTIQLLLFSVIVTPGCKEVTYTSSAK